MIVERTGIRHWLGRSAMNKIIFTLLTALFLTINGEAGAKGLDVSILNALERGDYATALARIRPLAGQGDANAQSMLASMYFDGSGVPQDDREAAKWYRLAADQGDEAGQYFLGIMYGNGRGVPKNYVEAARWWQRAAEQGNVAAAKDLAFLYTKGLGVPIDAAAAAKWYRRAAYQDDPDAQYQLGLRYIIGSGVVKDYVAGHMWLNLAGAKGKDEAQVLRDKIERLMTRAQVAEAQKFAREWKPQWLNPPDKP